MGKDGEKIGERSENDKEERERRIRRRVKKE